MDCLVALPENFPPVSPERPYPLDFKYLAQAQLQDQRLQNLVTTDPKYHRMTDEGSDLHQLICFTPAPGAPWKICIPDSLLRKVVKWYHRVLVHPGRERMLQTIQLHFHHPDLRTRIERYVQRCDTCQRMKIDTHKYGELPPRNAELVPWGTVALDCIGPWTITIPNREISFHALTIIDTVTNFCDGRTAYCTAVSQCMAMSLPQARRLHF
jgi:Integrase zinc binding domain